MALRLERVQGRSARIRLAVQSSHDLWHAKRTTHLIGAYRVRLTAA